MITSITPNTFLISHPQAIKYSTKDANYKLTQNLFEINKEFIKQKITSKPSIISTTAEFVLQLYKDIQPTTTNNDEEDNNDIAIKTAKSFYNETNDEFIKFNGANKTDLAVISKLNGASFIFPPRCEFFNCDLFQVEINDKFDLIVLDPPWKNKFIRRRKGNVSGYKHTETGEIGDGLCKFFPSIVNENGIVAIWATNSKVDVILNEFLEKWGLFHVSTFYWLKVTKSNIPTTPFTKENGKQPYESLIIASKNKEEKLMSKLIISTPSSINSHKPPLTDLLELELNRKFDKKAELFSRYLQEEYTSYGNQVCKLNNLNLFEKF